MLDVNTKWAYLRRNSKIFSDSISPSGSCRTASNCGAFFFVPCLGASTATTGVSFPSEKSSANSLVALCW